MNPSDLICKCEHKKSAHGKYSEKALNGVCSVSYLPYDNYVDNCREFQADNLAYLAQKYNEKTTSI
jgi:hypothetical protein